MKRLLDVIPVLGALVLCAPVCSRDADRWRAPHQPAAAAADRTTVIATVPDDATPPAIPLPARGPHPVAPSGNLEFIFGERGGGVAFISEKDGKLQVVHNGRAGKWYEVVGDVVLGPDGERCAYGALAGGNWRVVVDGVEGPGFSTVKLPTFSPDGAHVVYQAMAGERWHLVLDGKVNPGTRTRYASTFGFSADSSRLAFVADVDDRDLGRLVVSDLAFKAQTVVDPAVTAVVWNSSRSRVAAVAASGTQRRAVIADLDKPDRVTRGAPVDGVDGLVFGPDGRSVAYVAERSGAKFLVLNEKEAPLTEPLAGPLVVRPDGRAVGALLVSDGTVTFRQLIADGGSPEGRYEEAEGLTYAPDGSLHAYAARRGQTWSIVVNGKEGPSFDRVVTPQFSPDGRLVVYRARKDGKRFVVVADADARTVRQHAPYEQVFPVRFTDDGRSIAYGVKDGRQLAWKVEAP